MWDPYVDCSEEVDGVVSLESAIKNKPALYFIGTKHLDFLTFPFVDGSVVLDPWRYIPDKAGVEVIRIGAKDYTEQPVCSVFFTNHATAA